MHMGTRAVSSIRILRGAPSAGNIETKRPVAKPKTPMNLELTRMRPEHFSARGPNHAQDVTLSELAWRNIWNSATLLLMDNAVGDKVLAEARMSLAGESAEFWISAEYGGGGDPIPTELNLRIWNPETAEAVAVVMDDREPGTLKCFDNGDDEAHLKIRRSGVNLMRRYIDRVVNAQHEFVIEDRYDEFF